MSKKDEKRLTCGIVMPISAIDGCSEAHWSDVLTIISAAADAAGFDPNLVSNADDVGIIQKRIIQNLYDNPVVVCDVSGKNPNVMFELGMRLAFDKPTIIIKDDVTSYTFDTSPIEHLEYPRDLRFGKIVEFKSKLSDKIAKTHAAAAADSGYTTFLKHFGEFKVAKIEQKEVSGQEFIIEELKSLRKAVERIDNRHGLRNLETFTDIGEMDIFRLDDMPDEKVMRIIALLERDFKSTARLQTFGGARYLMVTVQDPAYRTRARQKVRQFLSAVTVPAAGRSAPAGDGESEPEAP